jgi:mRNA deadenylase 3'-5' endonuclease subunit Ccr4
LDYIFIFGEGLVIQNVEQICDIGEIPNAHFPSDHVPVVATFAFN